METVITPSAFFEKYVSIHYGNVEELAAIHKALWKLDNQDIYYLVNEIAEFANIERTPAQSVKPATLPNLTFLDEEREILPKKELQGNKLKAQALRLLTKMYGESKWVSTKEIIANLDNKGIGLIYGKIYNLDPHLRYAILLKASEANDKIKPTVPKGCNQYVINELE